jgi:GntR family transcriptional regulator
VQHDLIDLRGIYDELVAQGINPTTKILEFGIAVPPSPVTERLRSRGRELVYWKRLYLRQNEPFAVAWVYLARNFPEVTHELVAVHTSYYIFEVILGMKVDHADLSIRAETSTAELRKLLRMAPATPVIVMERVSYLADGTPIEFARYCAHADSYEFSFKVSHRADIPGGLMERVPNGHAS